MITRWSIYAIAALSCISILCVAFSVQWWPLEPLTAFLVQATVALITITILAIRAMRYRVSAVLATFCVVGLVLLVPYSRSEPPVNKTPCCVSVNIGHANLFSHAGGIAKIKKWATENKIDILELTELPDADRFTIVDTFPEFPYAIEGDQPGRRKVAILSKFPLETIQNGSSTVLAATAQIDRNSSLAIISTHPTIAMSPKHMRSRNQAITDAFAEATKHRHAIVVGDFNSAPWSPVLSKASVQYDFKRASAGAFESTWITPLPIFGLPIDHIYASYEIDIHQSGVGPFIFSDHWPIYATLAIPNEFDNR